MLSRSKIIHIKVWQLDIWLCSEIPPQEKASCKIPSQENTSQQNTSRLNVTQQNTYDLGKDYVQI
jgi:hypothetical protein